jgi:Homeo-prospero domain
LFLLLWFAPESKVIDVFSASSAFTNFAPFSNFQVPPNFRFVVEQTLREFFRAIQGGKDTEQSWKKSIYKVISRMDDPVPEYFKSPNFLEQLE